MLYAIALIRWLRRTVPGFTCEGNFGGGYYLYLRGMDGRSEETGIGQA